MTQQADGAREYKRKQIESASPVQLVLLLYDGAIDQLNKAEVVVNKKEDDWIERFHNHLIAAQNIITELTVTLNMEQGGDLAKNLYRLYEYMNYRLVNANMEKDVAALDDVKQLLINLKEGWEGLSKKVAGQPPAGDCMDGGLNIQG